jgi:two-component system response regulator AtoC
VQEKEASAASANVLVVDDDRAVRTVLATLLSRAGMTPREAPDGEAALELIEREPIDLVVTDVRMPGMGGMKLLGEVGARFSDVPVIVLTAHGTVPLAVEAMKAGAADFILKPFDRDEIVYAVRKALLQGRHAETARDAAPISVRGMVLASQAMRSVSDLVARAAQGTATVLLRGESGTGKELAARAIHETGRRRDGPFVKIHCAALPEALLESELFGYEKGAFTGAVTRKPGRVELAQGGTLFLDEIGDITPATQVKLLRLLQEREFERLGGTQTLKVDVRFVAATHRDLDAMVAKGEFREDLFYRLAVIPIRLPPLRERREEIVPLLAHFCETLGPPNGKPRARLAKEALALLEAEPWPGNVRQLQNFVERLIVLSDAETITAAEVKRELARGTERTDASSARMDRAPDAPSSADPSAPPETLDARRRGAEKESLEQALARAAGNRALAARLLGVSRRTLYYKLAQHGIG